ncbi:MAG: hypothetical protein LC685_01585, partial [Actinobacteria bacterium]|nr:hypothetical protein [Actinomycetota bacterium]
MQIGLSGATSPDVVDVHVALGSRVVVVGGLRLAKDATTASTWASQQVARALEWTGPGVAIFAGDLVDLLASDLNTPSRALSAHGRLAAAVQAFLAVPDRRVICLAGTRDGRLARDGALARTLGQLLGSDVAVTAELTVETGGGARRVRVEGGYRPDGPGPDVLPTLPEAAWLDGLGSLGDPSRLRPFVASRVAYRGIAPSILIAVLGVLAAIAASRVVPAWSAGCLLAALEIAAAIAWTRAHRGWAAAVAELPDDLRAAAAGEGHDQSVVPADRARDREVAVRLVAHAGYAGVVTGQSLDPQLASIGDGFFASVGSGSEVIHRWPGRLGLPAVFLPHRQASWLEMEAGAALRIRLYQARLDLAGGTLLERLAARKPVLRDAHASVVGGWPEGPSFPERAAP